MDCKRAEKEFKRRFAAEAEKMQAATKKPSQQISQRIRQLEAKIETNSADELALIDCELDVLYQQLLEAQEKELTWPK